MAVVGHCRNRIELICFLLGSVLEPLGKQEMVWKRQGHNEEKIRGHSRGRTHNIHIIQEDHCCQLSIVVVRVGSTFLKSLNSITNDPGLVDTKTAFF
jgi:hypothetical protein